MDNLLYEVKGFVGILTIDRPEALNALNRNMIAGLSALLDEIAVSEIRCLILTGAGGKSFVAGADIGEMADLNPEQAEKFSIEGNMLMEKLENLPIPVIAAVNGYALGGGSELALACDIRLASENAVFSLPEAGLGIPPGFGGVQRLARVAGIAKAKELALTTNRVKAVEALSIGLVNAVCPPEGLMDEAMRMAEKIASNAPFAVKAIKQIANESVGVPLVKASRTEARLFGDCFATGDQKQAMKAFLDKKKPEAFTGK